MVPGALLPRLAKGVIVSVHDVHHTSDPSGFDAEGKFVVDYLEGRGVTHFTASPAKQPEFFAVIMRVKERPGIEQAIHYNQFNSMINFCKD